MPDVRASYRRPDWRPVRPHRASGSEWAQNRKAILPKGCQVCGKTATDLHHVLSRDGDGTWPSGDDYRSNLAPLCRTCHRKITERDMVTRAQFRATMTEHQLDYLKRRIGPAWTAYLERHYPEAFRCDVCECGGSPDDHYRESELHFTTTAPKACLT